MDVVIQWSRHFLLLWNTKVHYNVLEKLLLDLVFCHTKFRHMFKIKTLITNKGTKHTLI